MLIPLLLTDYERMLAYPCLSHMLSLPPQFLLLPCLLPLAMKKCFSPERCRAPCSIPSHHLLSLILLKVGGRLPSPLPRCLRLHPPLSGSRVFRSDKLLLNKCLLTSLNLALQTAFPTCLLGTDYILHPNVLRCISHH